GRGGAGGSRGRLPGATSLACPGVSQPGEPRGETTQPTPGITGESTPGSLGVAEKALPSASTTQRYEVSSEPPGSMAAWPDTPCPPLATARSPRGSPAGGRSGHAWSSRISARRARAYSLERSPCAGTFTCSGSP